MLKKVIKFTNPFTEEEVEEEHYFHLSKADFVELQTEHQHEPKATDPNSGKELEGYSAKLQRVQNADSTSQVLEVMKDLVRRSYVKRDGDRSLKSPEIFEEFKGSEAYSELLFELATDAEKTAEFMMGVVPKSLLEQYQAAVAAGEVPPLPTPDKPAATETPALEKADAALNGDDDPTGLTKTVTPQVLSQQQLREMDPAELQAGLADGRYKLA